MRLVGARALLIGRLRYAADRCQGAVDKADHVADADLPQRFREPVAAKLATFTTNEAALFQTLQDLLEENPDSSVMVKVTFDNKKTEKAAVTFWLQASNYPNTQTTATPTGWSKTSASFTP